MTLQEIQKQLALLKRRGLIQSKRKGSTGVGYTLEQELNLSENNLAIPDIGGRIELKATRKKSTSLITLFTFNKSVWHIPQKKIIKTYGYLDEKKNRQSLYSSVFYAQENPQNLKIELDKSAHKIHLHHDSGILLATWSIYTMIGKFTSKLERLLMVLADNQINQISGKEEFLFDEAYLLENPSPDNFLQPPLRVHKSRLI